MYHRIKSIGIFVVLAALACALQACTVPITLKTRPQGATVIANGEIIGVTPLEIDPDELFPAKFKGYQWERQGTLTFERVGCKAHTLPIDNEAVKHSVRIDMDCEPGAAAMVPGTPGAKSSSAPKAGTLERLEELNQMKQHGLINEEEFQRLRRRVLNQF